MVTYGKDATMRGEAQTAGPCAALPLGMRCAAREVDLLLSGRWGWVVGKLTWHAMAMFAPRASNVGLPSSGNEVEKGKGAGMGYA